MLPLTERKSAYAIEIEGNAPDVIHYCPDGQMPPCGRLMTRIGQYELNKHGYFTYMHGDLKCAVVTWPQP